jgi:solute carrier family 30 (zinc transporter), member 9
VGMIMIMNQIQRQPFSRTLSSTAKGWTSSSLHDASSLVQSFACFSSRPSSSLSPPFLSFFLEKHKNQQIIRHRGDVTLTASRQQQQCHDELCCWLQQQRTFTTLGSGISQEDDDDCFDDNDDDPKNDETMMDTRIRNSHLFIDHESPSSSSSAAAAAGQHQHHERRQGEQKLVDLRRRLLLCRRLQSSSFSSLGDSNNNDPTSSRKHQSSLKPTTHIDDDASDSSEPSLPPKTLLKKAMAKLFLEGETKGGAVAGDESKSTTSSGDSDATTAAAPRKRLRKRRLVLDPVRHDFYSTIRQKQVLQKEASRVKTAHNVNRALCGNVVICVAKLGAYFSSGSSGMLAEFIHSVVDCANQALLLVGLRDSRLSADSSHNYGYGKSVYFWALVSALGTFFLGFGVSMTHAVHNVMDPSLTEITWQVWSVLLLSLVVDGYVLQQTMTETYASKPPNMSYWKHVTRNIRDPATLAVLLEDGAACLGVVLALGGIAASHVTGNPIFDGVAGIGISALLGCMGIVLVRMNHRFLLGQAVDDEITQDIGRILLARRSVDSIGAVQSQWTGPETFSYKCEVDFDGTYLAAQLMKYYQNEFLTIRNTMDDELQVLLALYAEDVMRSVEREVRHVEALIRSKYPGAEYIELEPFSLDADRLAIDDNLEEELRKIEEKTLDRFLKSLRENPSVTASMAEPASSSLSSMPPSAAEETQMYDDGTNIKKTK